MAEKRKIWIVTPQKEFGRKGKVDIKEILDALSPHYANPIREIMEWRENPFDIQLVLSGGGGIYQARNVMATQFMEATNNDNDRLHFVDYDLMPTAQDYIDIWSHDISVVGGLYTIRADNGHWVLNLLPGATASAKGILPVMELGTGFKCFKRGVFRKVLADNPWLDCESDSDHSKRFYSFFSMGPVWDKRMWPGKGRGLTEDYWFDWLCRESGIITCAATKVQLRHRDSMSNRVYPAVFPPAPGALPPEAKEP